MRLAAALIAAVFLTACVLALAGCAAVNLAASCVARPHHCN